MKKAMKQTAEYGVIRRIIIVILLPALFVIAFGYVIGSVMHEEIKRRYK